MKYSRRAVCVTAALICLATGPVLAKKKPKDPPPPDPRTGIAVDWGWGETLSYGTCVVTGKVYNQSGKDYDGVSLRFGLWAKDGDKMGENWVILGAMPQGTRANLLGNVTWQATGDKPHEMRLLEIRVR